MGTRNLIMVVYKGKYRVAQYGQWDGYPTGQGYDVLDFCRKQLKDAVKRDHFIKQIGKTKFLADKKIGERYEAEGIKGEWITMEEAERMKEKFPQFSRDTAAKVLDYINNSKEKVIELRNSIDFARDSLFCEWAYLIDLDNGTLECYSGFNTKPIAATERFGNLKPAKKPKGASSNEYFPISLLTTFSLDKLPTKRKFKSTLEKISSAKDEANGLND